jgi:hypothetical protein
MDRRVLSLAVRGRLMTRLAVLTVVCVLAVAGCGSSSSSTSKSSSSAASTLAPVAPAVGLSRLPTGVSGNRNVQVRPRVISFTGDGTGFFGGFTRRSAVRRPSRVHLQWAGRLHWTVWNGDAARAGGAAWLNDGIPDDARGTFHPYPASLHAYRLRHGLFTRLRYRYRFNGKGYVGTLRAFAPGYWDWLG